MLSLTLEGSGVGVHIRRSNRGWNDGMLIGAENLSVLGKARLGHIKSLKRRIVAWGFTCWEHQRHPSLIIIAYGSS
jgi:hypothetical protein